MHWLIKRKGVRRNDVAFMNGEWKEAIGKKRKHAKNFSKNPTQENYVRKIKSTKCRRKAIKEYWTRKTDGFNANPAEFYKTFKPFLDDKSKAAEKFITLEKDGYVLRDLSKIVDCLLDYFSSVANDIGNITLLELNDEQLKSHTSV